MNISFTVHQDRSRAWLRFLHLKRVKGVLHASASVGDAWRAARSQHKQPSDSTCKAYILGMLNTCSAAMGTAVTIEHLIV